jgi:hypothetical protein
MKEEFICKECDGTFSIAENLSKHVKIHGLSNKEYYDKWFKKRGEGICLVCDDKTPFNSITKGYRKYCSIRCKRIGAGKKTSKTWEEKNKKIKNNYKFECLECHEKFETSIKLSNHIIKIHNKKEYYDKWLNKENKGICKICGSKTEFYGRFDLGYRDCCSKKCSDLYRYEQGKKTNLKKHGVENVFELDSVKEKIKQTFIENYGVDNNMKSKKGRGEYKRSMKKKHGVEWPLQDKNILEKNQKSAKTLKKFRNTNIWYQGTYELDFLEKYYDKFPDLIRAPSIKYLFEEKEKIYHPDFYIPSKNLIIEIKSSWILNIDKEINEKKKAVISNGFEYLMILDKNYPEF